MNKKKLLELIGDKCFICGYNKCERSLHFHHIKRPSADLLEWRRGSKTITNSIAKLPEWLQLQQMSSIITLCANCHGEVHAGLHPNVPCPEDDVEPHEVDKSKPAKLEFI